MCFVARNLIIVWRNGRNWDFEKLLEQVRCYYLCEQVENSRNSPETYSERLPNENPKNSTPGASSLSASSKTRFSEALVSFFFFFYHSLSFPEDPKHSVKAKYFLPSFDPWTNFYVTCFLPSIPKKKKKTSRESENSLVLRIPIETYLSTRKWFFLSSEYWPKKRKKKIEINVVDSFRTIFCSRTSVQCLIFPVP